MERNFKINSRKELAMKYPKRSTKQDILTAINLLILFCRRNEKEPAINELENILLELEEELK